MKKLYCVYAATGKWEDSTFVQFAAYSSKKNATNHANLLNKLAANYGLDKRCCDILLEKFDEFRAEFGFNVDSLTGIRFGVSTIKFYDKVPRKLGM